jgi:uncharacterized protein (TIGR02246 family)
MRQPADGPHAALCRFAERMLSADSDAMAEASTADSELLLQDHDAIVGRDAIREFWRTVFADNRTAAFEAGYPVVEVHTDRAYALGWYRETAVERDGGRTWLITGRAVVFMRCEADGIWRFTLLLNSHDRPPQEIR